MWKSCCFGIKLCDCVMLYLITTYGIFYRFLSHTVFQTFGNLLCRECLKSWNSQFSKLLKFFLVHAISTLFKSHFNLSITKELLNSIQKSTKRRRLKVLRMSLVEAQIQMEVHQLLKIAAHLLLLNPRKKMMKRNMHKTGKLQMGWTRKVENLQKQKIVTTKRQY